jgi:6-phosphogluconolactonase/glucosamine-6-phosphate isomerase/deaminase
MDGTLTSVKNGVVKPHDFDQRVEAILQSEFKAVKRLLQEHSEALIAIAEALIEREELVAEDIKQLIEEADAKRVTKTVLSEFEPLLGAGSNGHTRSTVPNGHGNGSSTSPRIIDSTPLNYESGTFPMFPNKEISPHSLDDEPFTS